MTKLKIAIYWGAACGGCDVAILDTQEKILEIAELADIVFWPIAVDFKYQDLENMEDQSIDICMYHGSVRNSEQEQVARLLREKGKTVIAFGSCACFGGITGLGNLFTREEILRRVYKTTPSTSNPDNIYPQSETRVREGKIFLPYFQDAVSSLNKVVKVDYYIPGCPPPVDLIINAVDAIKTGNLPPEGSVLAPEKGLCDECPRERKEKVISEIKRFHEVQDDGKTCLLEQGILCMGPATRAGCEGACIKVNMACRGCMGPTPAVIDQGAKMIGSLGSVVGIENEETMSENEVKKLLDKVEDLVGSLYSFTLPAALINRKITKKI
ncbi:MAG: oxidoreductase [bacterium]